MSPSSTFSICLEDIKWDTICIAPYQICACWRPFDVKKMQIAVVDVIVAPFKVIIMIIVVYVFSHLEMNTKYLIHET